MNHIKQLYPECHLNDELNKHGIVRNNCQHSPLGTLKLFIMVTQS